MSKDTATRLREAMATGEVLGIVYHGGSQPGAYRLIAPIGIEGDKVRARCYTSKAVKVFALAKIDIRDAAAPTPAEVSATWTPLSQVAWSFSTIDEVARHFRPQLEAKGWHVEHGPFEDGDALWIHTRLKSGKPRRTPTVVFSYEARAYDIGIDDDGDLVRINERARVRPWVLRAPGKSSSWGRILQAFVAATGLSEAIEAMAEAGASPA